MNDIMFLYLFTRLDGIREFLFFLITVVGIGEIVAIAGFIILAEDNEAPASRAKAKNYAIGFGIVFMLLSISHVLIPNRKDMAIIIGGHLLVEASKSQVVTDTAGKLNELIQGELDDAIKNMKKKVKE